MLKPGIPIPRSDGLKIGLPAKQGLVWLWTLKRPDIVPIAMQGPLGWSPLVAATKLKIPVSTGFHTNFHSYSKYYGIGFSKKPIAAYLRKFHNRALATPVPTEGLPRTELPWLPEPARRLKGRRYKAVLAVAAKPAIAQGVGRG